MNTDKNKLKLEEEKKLLESELSSLGHFDKETNNWEASADKELNDQEVQDEADLADKSEDYGERFSTVETLELRIKEIDSALYKVENGGYGTCEKCGMPIEEDRLEANLSARTCKNCMEK